eukprot:COSAG04_NODE_531_length_12994_cov_3.113687_8_plen_367_part_00
MIPAEPSIDTMFAALADPTPPPPPTDNAVPPADGAARHEMQARAIVASLARAGLLRPPRPAAGSPPARLTTVEFGAADGVLSALLLEQLEKHGQGAEHTRQILVDRDATPGAHPDGAGPVPAAPASRAERVRADIGALDLPALLAGGPCRGVGVAKHLCGEATDHALRCLVAAGQRDADASLGVAILSCCHHSCAWQSYAHQEFFVSRGVTDEPAFERLCATAGEAGAVYSAVTAAATSAALEAASAIGLAAETERVALVAERAAACVVGDLIRAATGQPPAQADARREEGGLGVVAEIAVGAARAAGAPHAERLRLALRAKRLLDEGRRQFLLANGWAHAELSQAVAPEVSPEGTLLLGSRGPAS